MTQDEPTEPNVHTHEYATGGPLPPGQPLTAETGQPISSNASATTPWTRPISFRDLRATDAASVPGQIQHVERAASTLDALVTLVNDAAALFRLGFEETAPTEHLRSVARDHLDAGVEGWLRRYEELER